MGMGVLAAQARYPIETIRVTGTKLYNEKAVIAITGLKPGDPLDERKIETARDNLLVTGAFSNVNFRYDPAPSQKGYVLTFELTDVDQLFEYRFDRLNIDELKVRAYLKEREPLFDARIPGADTVLARFSAAIAAYLKEQGKPADVVGRVRADKGDTFVLFSPSKPAPAVATVDFTGNKVVHVSQLRNAIHPVAVGTQYSETRFRELLEVGVRPLYDARGRLRMKFTRIEAEPLNAVQGLAIKVEIDEGESFSFGPTKVSGVSGGEDAMVKAAAIPEGEVADLQIVTAGQYRIQRLLRANGHMAAEITVNRQLNDEERKCSVTFQVTPGPRYTFGTLSFQGLDVHGIAEMKRIWTMEKGSTYNGEYPDMFVTRITEEQLFDNLQNARAVATPNHQTHVVDVRLIFNEPKPKIPQ